MVRWYILLICTRVRPIFTPKFNAGSVWDGKTAAPFVNKETSNGIIEPNQRTAQFLCEISSFLRELPQKPKMNYDNKGG